MTKMSLTEAPDAVLVKAYVDLRDRRAKRKADFTAQDESDKTRQEKIEIELMRRFEEREIDSVSAAGVGTAYRSTRTSATVADWDAFLGHVVQNEAYELLEHRANKKAVENFKEEHEELPPGVSWSSIHTVNIRRK